MSLDSNTHRISHMSHVFCYTEDSSRGQLNQSIGLLVAGSVHLNTSSTAASCCCCRQAPAATWCSASQMTWRAPLQENGAMTGPTCCTSQGQQQQQQQHNHRPTLLHCLNMRRRRSRDRAETSTLDLLSSSLQCGVRTLVAAQHTADLAADASVDSTHPWQHEHPKRHAPLTRVKHVGHHGVAHCPAACCCKACASHDRPAVWRWWGPGRSRRMLPERK